MRSFVSLLLVLGLLGAAPAYAQKEEPKPPGAEGEDSEVPDSGRPDRGRPRPRRAGEGASIAPTATRTEDGPAARSGSSSAQAFDPLDWKNGLGAYARYIFVTNLMLKPYLEASTPLNSFAVGLQYIRRFSKFDVVTTLDFSWLSLQNGNWLAKGNDPALDTKYVQFNKLSFLIGQENEASIRHR